MSNRRRTRPPSALHPGVEPLDLTTREVARRFRERTADGARLRVDGSAKGDPSIFLTPRYTPRHELELFDARIWLTGLKFDEALSFFVAYVAIGDRGAVHPRIYYKDSSLVWRVASHFVHDEDEYWIGKGEVRAVHEDDWSFEVTAEETTNLPFELQRALDAVSREKKRVRDDHAIERVLREAPSGRLWPYPDFTRPRRAASERWAIHGDRPIATFRRADDPRSLDFVKGYEPDFAQGALEEWSIESRFFGGRLRKVRVLSANRAIQYLFFASPTHAWLNPPQALSVELSSFGVRTIDVHAPDDMCMPGYEYHDEDESQIPPGFAGAAHPDDPHRADASAWLDAMPVIRAFRRSLRSML